VLTCRADLPSQACGLSEGTFAAAMYYEANGDAAMATALRGRARRMGFGKEWRKQARERTGTGGVASVSLHSAWPGKDTPRGPPLW
jgi:uncharacterized protein (DUF2141 family)